MRWGNKLKWLVKWGFHVACAYHLRPSLLLWHITEILPGASGHLYLPLASAAIPCLCCSILVPSGHVVDWYPPAFAKESPLPRSVHAFHTPSQVAEHVKVQREPLGRLDSAASLHLQHLYNNVVQLCDPGVLCSAPWDGHLLDIYCVPGYRRGLHINCLLQSS